MWMPASAIEIVAPILLMLTILSLGLAPRAWPAFLALTFLAGYVSGQLTWLAGIWVILLIGACHVYTTELPRAPRWRIGLLRASAFVAIVGLCVGLSIHVLPGFHNIQALPPTKLTPEAIAYSEWINFDKTMAGVLIIGICYRKLITEAAPLGMALRRAAIPAVVTIALVVLLSTVFGYVRWEPKWTSQFWLWAAINLLATCMSEEAFFRAFIQSEAERLFARRRGGAMGAIACSAMLFGIAHIAGGRRGRLRHGVLPQSEHRNVHPDALQPEYRALPAVYLSCAGYSIAFTSAAADARLLPLCPLS